MAKSPESVLYHREFQDRTAPAIKVGSGWLRKIISGQKPAETKIYGHAFHEGKK